MFKISPIKILFSVKTLNWFEKGVF